MNMQEMAKNMVIFKYFIIPTFSEDDVSSLFLGYKAKGHTK